MKRSLLELAVALACLIALSACVTIYVNRSGWTLYYGDAEAHLDIARRVLDSRTPGYDQIGTVWLPLPHALMLPFVGRDDLWRNGLAGAIPASGCFVLAGAFLFAATRRAFRSTAAAISALGLFALNPNLLYLQATPMTESVFLACFMALLYFSILFEQTQRFGAAIGAGLAAMAGTLSRYEAWFAIPFVAAFFLIAPKRRRVAGTLIFCLLASLGPLYWLAHNWWLGDPLQWYNGPYSPKAIYQRALAQGMQPYPGDGDWKLAAQYFTTAARLCAGWVVVGVGAIGIIVALWKRVPWPLVLIALPPVFCVWSMHSSVVPIFVPILYPHSYYNTRYGLEALPLLAFSGGALALLVPQKLRWAVPLAVFIAAAAPWLIRPQPDDWICWKESQVNSVARRAWTAEAASFLKGSYRRGEGIFTSLGDLAGIYREAGIPLRETLQEGNEPMWMATVERPSLFLQEQWAVTISGDAVATAVQRASFKTGPHYELVKAIIVPGAPPVEIYERRSAQIPSTIIVNEDAAHEP